MKTAGIIGGMGPGTTADFYKEINGLSEQYGYDSRPELLIWNIPLNYQVEQELLVHQQGLDKYLPHLIDGARKLERAGADFLVIPCNTVHELFDQFSGSVDVPFLHIVGETVDELKKRDVGSVALLATGQTIGSDLYQGFLRSSGIDCIVPGGVDQARLNNIVADLVTSEGAAAKHFGAEQGWLNLMVESYASSVGTVVLGCTDFHIMLEDPDPDVVIDSMHILAEATVNNIYDI